MKPSLERGLLSEENSTENKIFQAEMPSRQLCLFSPSLKVCIPYFICRCSLTTVDPEKGVISKDGEPLKTLRK